MTKIDKRINYRLVIDTETCPVDKTIQKVDPYNMFVYDIGWVVTDKKGRVYDTFSSLNADIFLDEKDLMQSAYYANKIPMYEEKYRKGEIEMNTFRTIRKKLNAVVEKYNINEIYAHNMRFDHATLNTTQRWLTKSKYRYFFPYGSTICDTLKMSKDVLGKMPTYIKFCEDNGYLTKANKPRFTAEIVYRYVSGDNTFIESHTALEDALIEKDILAYCFRQHKKMTRTLW